MTPQDGHDAACEAELTSHGYTPCRCDERAAAPGAPDKEKPCRSKDADVAVDCAGTVSHDAPSVAGAPDIPALIERLQAECAAKEGVRCVDAWSDKASWCSLCFAADALTALSASHEALKAMQLYTLQQLEAAEAQVAALTARVAQLEGALTAVNALATEWAAQHGQRFGGPYRECASKLRPILAALTEPEPEK
jgi:hypothetical protein